jgi:hypothetical protein
MRGPSSRTTRLHPEGVRMAAVSVRYIDNDLNDAMSFYTTHLGFKVKMHPAPTFAMLSRENLRLLLSSAEL